MLAHPLGYKLPTFCKSVYFLQQNGHRCNEHGLVFAFLDQETDEVNKKNQRFTKKVSTNFSNLIISSHTHTRTHTPAGKGVKVHVKMTLLSL